MALHGFLVNGVDQRWMNPSLEFCHHHQLLFEVKKDCIKFLCKKMTFRIPDWPNLVNLFFSLKKA